ncbi:hypothetical protein MIH18_05895 [Marinobacter sp. M3C]|jgi:hypothetical protein|uniref:hypothetical protein n=1 Tax=unclassified Marinobacter TaxID=83889 RepID=UPI00200D3498|nr:MULTISPECIES: hypothetical protein [unclassified Marinobacter]MCL1479926.1 hypothetical protein [Marinobacter sp.]UQG57352.1 hypothetical protein MIH16_06835 [Marinobacter sp. M4C]UQG61474.1 hypothetical protein MIH18_05895 [Marinobacter sp. M3C]UQG66156.1 hypothetical protein MIH17_06835 [Marinobacter sp. M2C]UQG70436.1 hypothetical protein MIH19_06830 [Marinobacter sp. M1C]
MCNIQALMQEIRDLAQEVEEFHEVEISLLIRTHQGEKSQFIRLQTEKEDTNKLSEDDLFQSSGPKWF